ncbi:2-keto-4-pentenoate hydratase/2-oxohepta-3-ene-1,7-dioic acid hydratase in catechol pathway [Psychrobacter sp. PL15]|uniref:fumarylacetoacetate hydrolase family protein n=1 Tax=unclassified Psychrobacter TaxID=196806 RepID=UPI001AE7476A|nr:fumarylacetoacetate hydrolase family protein [Psychrobacter sp. PL15]MEC5209957.1 2-keto-4-pentenoate hydratase/2-oxohepta-3-ene-1,7-dioic acid hydratase in catechol pathway [Psychrobacter sp. PL15]
MSQSLPSPVVNAAEENEVKATASYDKRAVIGKVVCVGRNYAAHAHELGNEVPTSPILFMKPASSVVFVGKDSVANSIVRPDSTIHGDTHYEVELCIQLSADLNNANIEQAQQAIGGVTLGLDLTLRDLQSQLKEKGQPWERAKCFDGACVLAEWIDPQAFGDFRKVSFQLTINDQLKQDGDSALMLFPVYELLAEISRAFSLQAGDVIMTGTPSGVGILQAGDRLRLKLGEHEWQARVQ